MSLQDENKLQVMQNACLRVCLQRDRLTHRSDLFAESNVTPLDVQRKLHTCEIVYSGLNELSTPFINNAFSRVSENSERVTRSSIRNELYIHKYRLDVMGGNIKVRGSKYYNKLPMSTREKATLKQFKNEMKRTKPFTTKYQ